MQLSWRLLLAPWVGAIVGFLSSRGLSLTPDQTAALVGILASAATAAQHVLEQWLAPKISPPVLTAVKSNDPARKPPGGPGGGAAAVLLLLALPITFSVSSCAALGLAPTQSADESIAYGYGLYTAVENALSASLAAGQVSKATAIAVDQKAGDARALLDAARAAETVNPSGAATDLATATQVLQALQVYLDNPHGSPP